MRNISKKFVNGIVITIYASTCLCMQISFAESLSSPYQPDRGFLKNDPYKKSKSRVELSGVKNESELMVVKEAINDILQLIRLFGLGNKLPDGRIIMENTRTHPAFIKLTTERGRREIDIEPASTRHDKKTYNWNIISNDKLEVDVIFKHQPLSLGSPEVPAERTYRLGFIKNQCDAKWCLNEAKRIN